MDNYNSREYSAFLDKVRDRARKSFRLEERNRWVEPIALTREKNYDRKTDELLAGLRNDRKETAA